jgi:hypothetical protein
MRKNTHLAVNRKIAYIREMYMLGVVSYANRFNIKENPVSTGKSVSKSKSPAPVVTRENQADSGFIIVVIGASTGRLEHCKTTRAT